MKVAMKSVMKVAMKSARKVIVKTAKQPTALPPLRAPPFPLPSGPTPYFELRIKVLPAGYFLQSHRVTAETTVLQLMKDMNTANEYDMFDNVGCGKGVNLWYGEQQLSHNSENKTLRQLGITNEVELQLK